MPIRKPPITFTENVETGSVVIGKRLNKREKANRSKLPNPLEKPRKLTPAPHSKLTPLRHGKLIPRRHFKLTP